jgi:hypothetical protein
LALPNTSYFVVDAETKQVTRYAASMQAHTDGEYRALLAECGFVDISFYPAIGDSIQPGLFALTGRRL